MRFSPGLAGSRETAVILGQSRHSRAVSTVLDVSRSFSVSSRGLVCITAPTPEPHHTTTMSQYGTGRLSDFEKGQIIGLTK
jgi:hypothetical protein